MGSDKGPFPWVGILLIAFGGLLFLGSAYCLAFAVGAAAGWWSL